MQLLPLKLHSVRDVHQLRFLAFIVTCFAAAAPEAAKCTGGAVVLRDWSFVKLESHAPRHRGFRIIGVLVEHPKKDASCEGMEWFSTEIKFMLNVERVMLSENGTLYRLEGPADATRHSDASRIANIMQPFCQSIWPLNARELEEEVSKFFRTDQAEEPFPLPQGAEELRRIRMAPGQPYGQRA